MTQFFFLIAAFFFLACNNTTTPVNRPATANPIPEQEKNLRSLIAKYPDSLLLEENLIQYFRDNGNYSAAIEETSNALKKDSLNTRMWYIQATLLSENEDTLHAIKAWEKVIKVDPRPDNYLSLGSLYALTKNPLAIAIADTVLNRKAEGVEVNAFFIKGLYYSSTGNKIKAIDLFDKCISLNYGFLFAYREKAICLYDLGKYLDALKVLELSLKVKQTNEEAYYWMGRCFEKLGKKEQAIQDYQLALEFDKDYVEAKDALAKLGVMN